MLIIVYFIAWWPTNQPETSDELKHLCGDILKANYQECNNEFVPFNRANWSTKWRFSTIA